MSCLNKIKVEFKGPRGEKLFESASTVENYSVIIQWFYAREVCSFNSSIKKYSH